MSTSASHSKAAPATAVPTEATPTAAARQQQRQRRPTWCRGVGRFAPSRTQEWLQPGSPSMRLETPGSEFKGQHMVERAQGFAQNAGPSAYHPSGLVQRPSCVHCHDGCVCGCPGDDASHVEGSTRTVNEKEIDNRMQAEGVQPAVTTSHMISASLH